MNEEYDFITIERKWQQRWRDARIYHTEPDQNRPKFYGLEYFPYPSGVGLSVGHFKNYAPTDAFLRYKSMCGFNVLHPMGWDAFGQPAENEAIKRQRNPRDMVSEYAINYKRQLDMIGISYDWDCEINSSDPSYYRWTQWIFLQLYRMGLAYRANAPVNWCPYDNTVLANEEVVNGRCWRCDTVIEKRQMPQWFFRITAYAERLLNDLDTLSWPENIKTMQRNWIGRSEGAEVNFSIMEHETILNVFTTRPDTLWGVTFMVIAPEHPLVKDITSDNQRDKVDAYLTYSQSRSEIDRLSEGKDKTGVWTGAYAFNPVNNEQIPIWIADYVVMGYGTGAIMAVPAHDQRDYSFACKYNLPIIEVYKNNIAVIGPFQGSCENESVIENTIQWLKEREIGSGVVNYKLRDWLISRQRYWGAPIPIIHCINCGEVPIPEEKLPVLLPDIENYLPTGNGESPLAALSEFVETTCPKCGSSARRETDTMGGFACSSWYFMRFVDPYNNKEPFSREAADYWLPVDMYVGGAEHAVMHLLYARFWTKVLFDAGLINFTEPFTQLRNQGMMLTYTPGRKVESEDKDIPVENWKVLRSEEHATIPEDQWVWRWVKMSKSYGNVITPDEAAEHYGADALRMYEMFIAPFEDNVQWSEEGIRGSVRFLARVWRIVAQYADSYKLNDWRKNIAVVKGKEYELRQKTHQTIVKVTKDIENFRFNTAIAALMELVNKMYEVSQKIPVNQHSNAICEAVEYLILLLAPITPHIADEMWQGIGNDGFLYRYPWPKPDSATLIVSEITIVIQINGKNRDRLVVAEDADIKMLEELSLNRKNIQEILAGRKPLNVIVVPGKLVNIVV